MWKVKVVKGNREETKQRERMMMDTLLYKSDHKVTGYAPQI